MYVACDDAARSQTGRAQLNQQRGVLHAGEVGLAHGSTRVVARAERDTLPAQSLQLPKTATVAGVGLKLLHPGREPRRLGKRSGESI